MKKIVLTIITVIFLISCSSNDNNSTNGGSSNVLLTAIAFNYPNNNDYSKYYTYVEGNKLSEIVDTNLNKEYYTYEGDFIKKIEYVPNSSSSTDERFFTYDTNGRIIEEVKLYHLNSVGERIVFTYLSNGNVSFQRYSGSLTSQTTPSYHGTYTLNSSGEILMLEEFSDTDSTIYRKYEYTYDDQKSPFVNVRDGSKDFKYILNGDNNVLTFNMMVSGNQVYSYTSEFSFTNSGYPATEHKTDQAGLTFIAFTYN